MTYFIKYVIKSLFLVKFSKNIFAAAGYINNGLQYC